ncbi:hypothetical protein ACTA71_000139 [Dictyostelium dimigraforme]
MPNNKLLSSIHNGIGLISILTDNEQPRTATPTILQQLQELKLQQAIPSRSSNSLRSRGSSSSRLIKIDIEFTINDVLLNQESLLKKSKYICTICFEFIHKKSIYQCRFGHFACEQCWKTSLEGIVNLLSDLSRCLVIEQLFGQEECCYEENGCKEITMVELSNHLKNCEFGFESCSNEGCKEILRFNSLDQHEALECTFKLVTCEYSKKNDIKINQLEDKECPKVTIDCLEGCLEKIQRDQMESHIEDDCNNAIIDCKYSKYGCEFEMKRSELQLHLENFNHQEFMGELIDELTEHIEEANKVHHELYEMVEGLKKEQKILYSI